MLPCLPLKCTVKWDVWGAMASVCHFAQHQIAPGISPGVKAGLEGVWCSLQDAREENLSRERRGSPETASSRIRMQTEILC